MNESNFPYGKISKPAQLGTLISQVRKGAGGHPGGPLGPGRGGAPRLIGEIERGKPTAEIGKVFQLLASLGLAISIQPRTSKDWRE
jgi:hypothetical protein